MDGRIAHYFSGELSEEEKGILLKELKSNPLLKKDILAYQNMHAIFMLSPELTDENAGKETLNKLIRKIRVKKTILFIAKGVSVAAAIGLLLVATWMVAISQQEELPPPVVSMQELLVPPGQRARLTLPDGTIAWLNAGSSLVYPSVFTDERIVHLTGEAYFDVAQKQGKPFIVSSDSMNIMALGTQFNIHCYPKADYFCTSLIHGSVKVYQQGKEGEAMYMRPNQQLFFKDGHFRIEEMEDKDLLLWKEGIYSFKEESLDKIIKKLELYYDVEIIVKDPRILRYEYTGKFRQRDGVNEILRIIQKIHHFYIDKDEDLNRITLRK